MNQARLTQALHELADTDYMSQAQLEFFRRILQEERDALLVSARETMLHMHEDGGATADPSDRATLEEESSLELQVRDRERKYLHTVDEALARIGDGRYGWCEETGEAIGIQRLLARPTASFSLDAQLRHERRRRIEGR